MNPLRRAPQQLVTVAYLFMIEGFLFFALMVLNSLTGKITLNLGVFAVIVGWGLLNLNRRSYSWSFVFVWFYIILAAIGTFLYLITTFVARFSLLSLVTVSLSGLFLTLKIWQLNVLHSAPVRRAFDLEERW